ncbi:MAG: TRAP transporter substrate-binding protein [Betaproteobacteria bacterium]|nr:TRAP transporter substrate-binding protein [Betaproteobacteria bacterium]
MKSATTRLALCAFVLPLTLANLPSAQAQERTLKVSYVTTEDSPYGKGVARFNELLVQKTKGRLKLRGYSEGRLGAEVQSISAAQGGVLEVALVSTAAVVGVVKEFAIFDLPFLFAEEREAYAVLDGAVGRQLLDKLTDKGLVGLCYWEVGFRQTTNSKRPVTRVEDFAGLKIRTIQNPVFLDVFNTLGANATPMAFTEVYTALESKAIDGQETPYNVIYTSKFQEVQRYLSATKHIYGPGVVLVSKKVWDSLAPADRKALQDGCDEARGYQRTVSREANAELTAVLTKQGMVFNQITPAERARMVERVKPVVEKYTKLIGEDLVKQAYADIAKARAATK